MVVLREEAILYVNVREKISIGKNDAGSEKKTTTAASAVEINKNHSCCGRGPGGGGVRTSTDQKTNLVGRSLDNNTWVDEDELRLRYVVPFF